MYKPSYNSVTGITVKICLFHKHEIHGQNKTSERGEMIPMYFLMLEYKISYDGKYHK